MIDHETAEPDGIPATSPRVPPSHGASESSVSVGLEEADSFDPLEPSPIGAYLRRQRTLRGVSIEELGALTRIPLRSLERLEAGEFDGETDGFARGFVRTVAAAIGLDVDDTIARMLQEPTLGVWERHQSGRRLKQSLVAVVLIALCLIGFLVLQAGWRLLVGSNAQDPSRQIVIWRDPVRSLAEAAGVDVDPAGEIAPSKGTRIQEVDIPVGAASRAPTSTQAP